MSDTPVTGILMAAVLAAVQEERFQAGPRGAAPLHVEKRTDFALAALFDACRGLEAEVEQARRQRDRALEQEARLASDANALGAEVERLRAEVRR